MSKKIEPQGTLPFSLVYNKSKGSQEELPHHLHDWCEITYIHGGKGTFVINQTFLQLQEGDLIVIPPNIPHRSILEAENRMISTALFLSPTISTYLSADREVFMNPFVRAKETHKFQHNLNQVECTTVNQLFRQIYKEQEKKDDYWEEAISAEITYLLIYLNRWVRNTKVEAEKVPANLMWMKQVLNYIEMHLNEHIRLGDLANEASLNPVYLSKKFKQTIGMTISDFLRKKRLLKAKELLKDSEENIELIAEHVGYKGLPYFYRSFKNEIGMTPNQYRKIKT